MTIRLTDAPGENIRAAVVTIDRVYLQGEGRVDLRTTPYVVDLVTLANDVDMLVDGAVVPSGAYGQLRFVVSGAYIEVERDDGSVELYSTPLYDQLPPTAEVAGELKTPSWDASGFKVKLPGDRVVVEGDQHVLLVDFDVAESFQTETGNGDVVMSPVVEATDFDLTTSITVYVDVDQLQPSVTAPVMSDTAVVLLDAEGNLESRAMLTDADGDRTWEVTFLYLDPSEGPFQLRIDVPDGATVTTDPAMPLTVDADPGDAEIVSVEAATVIAP